MIKKISYILIFLFLLFAGNFCYVYFGFYKDDIFKCNAELIYKFDTCVANNNILYLGESSNFTTSESDSNKESISELVADHDPNYKILTISKGAIHAGVFKVLIKKLKNNSNIKTIILTVNLRSFGINWIESDLETNLSREIILYSDYPPIIKKCMLSFKAYDNQELFKRKEVIKWHYKNDKFKLASQKYETVRDWDKDVFNKGIPNPDGTKNQEQTNIACHFIKNYAFTLTENNPRVKDLDEIVEFCKSRNIKLIFNLLPENFQKAEGLCGKDLEILMNNNADFLEKRYNKSTQFINNFSLLNDSCFIDKNWPTEHYIYFGRKKVAEKINEALKQLPFN